MSNIAIKVENLAKRYRIGLKEELHDTISGSFAAWIKSPLSNFRRVQKLSKFDENGHSEDIIWALKDVSFEVSEGEIVGIIGRNGAGKSTLLKILARITEPTSGKAFVNGRVASLLEVGTGFHPELTGRENIFLNGTILGMTKQEIERKFDEIVDFSEIEKFIDTPVKRYSSGMRVRLAFAVAAHLEPEILLVDEVLAVGDTGFQKKCLGKIGEVAGEGRTVLFVTHNMSTLSSLCKRTLLLNNGQKKSDGPTSSIVKEYLSLNSTKSTGNHGEVYFHNKDSADRPFVLHALRTLDEKGNKRKDFMNSESVIVEFEFSVLEEIPHLMVGFDLKTEVETVLFRSYHNDLKEILNYHPKTNGRYRVRATIPEGLLNGGLYYVDPCINVFKKYHIVRDIRGLEINISFDVPNPDYTYPNDRRPGLLSPFLNWYQEV